MNSKHSHLPRFKLIWLSAWPLWTLLVFASIAAARLLPAGYVRAAIAAPILVLAPGSLTLGAIFGERRPKGAAFVCYAALLGAIWSALASLALYALRVRITADSTYWCLLAVSLILAVMAQARLRLRWKGRGTRVARRAVASDPDLSQAEAHEAESRATAVGRSYLAFVSVVAGIGLLAGGLYAFNRIPRPAPVGYTWITWTDLPIKGEISIGSTGANLRFRIIHHESDTTSFRLTAAWMGRPFRPLANPVTLRIGPDRTFRGALFIPPLPNGCTYRVIVAITSQQIDPLTKKPQTWSIDADIRDPRKSTKNCA